jgi:Stress responsive A/B Barrel Domain
MIRHIVLWKFQEHAAGKGKRENLLQARDMLLSLKKSIPGMVEWEVGITEDGGEQAADLSLNSTFPTVATLRAYQAHPDHLAVVQFLRSVQIGKTVADYAI